MINYQLVGRQARIRGEKLTKDFLINLNFMVMLLNAGRVDMAEESLAKANALIEGAIITEGEGQ